MKYLLNHETIAQITFVNRLFLFVSGHSSCCSDPEIVHWRAIFLLLVANTFDPRRNLEWGDEKRHRHEIVSDHAGILCGDDTNNRSASDMKRDYLLMVGNWASISFI